MIYIYFYLSGHRIIRYAPWQVRNNSVHCQVYISTKLRRLGSLVSLSTTWLTKNLYPVLNLQFFLPPKCQSKDFSMNAWDLGTVGPFQSNVSSVSNLLKLEFLCSFGCHSATLPMNSMTLPLWCGLLLLKLETLACHSLQKLQSLKVRSPAPCFVFFSFPWQGSEEAYQSLVTLKSKNF